jgi:hypothetical protein
LSLAARRIDGTVGWSGDVELEGDCIIAANAILHLAPGCRVVSPAGAAAPRLVVEGTLVARGRPENPVILGAPIVSAGGWARLSHCRLEGRGGEGLHLFGSAHRLEHVSVSGFETGLFVRDGETAAADLSFSDCATAIVVGKGGRLRWDGGGVAAAAGGAPARIVVEGELIARGARGAISRSRPLSRPRAAASSSPTAG